MTAAPPALVIRDDPTAIAAWEWLAPRMRARGRLGPDIRGETTLAMLCVSWSLYVQVCRLARECPGDAQARQWRDEMGRDCRQRAEEWCLIPRERAALALVDSDGVDVRLRQALTGARARR